MTQALPPRANLDWLRKTAKQKLAAMKADRRGAKLADAQLAVARDHGFPSWRALKAHLDARPDPDAPPEPVVAAFLRAVGDGEIEKVRTALAAIPRLVNAVGPHPYWGGRPQPLHVAIETKRRDLFDLLLAAGADPAGDNHAYDHWSPIMLTVSRDQPEMRAELIAHGAPIGLFEALLMGDDERAANLLERGLPPMVPGGGSVLAYARTPFAIDRLLELGADATETDRWGTTPLQAMSRAGADARELVRHMMVRGLAASPEQFARLGDLDAVRMLAAADPAVAQSAMVLVAAVDSGNVALVRWLISTGADVNARCADRSRQTALHNAAWNGNFDMVKLLVETGADRTVRDAEHDSTPWGWAQTAITVTNNPACAEIAAWLEKGEG